jgi:hypothetical protein
MAEKKPLIGRGTITVDKKGTTRGMGGFWRHDPQPSPTSWVGRAFSDYRELLKTGQRVSELNDQYALAKAKNQAPPEYDIHVRKQQVKQDLQKLEAVRSRLSALDQELLKREYELSQPFQYPSDARSALLRSELRAHLKSMKPAEQHSALRKAEYRAALAEQPAAISGVAETFRDAVIKEEAEFKFGNELAELKKARDALETSVEAFASVKLTVENEAQAVSGQLPELPPGPPTKPWVE